VVVVVVVLVGALAGVVAVLGNGDDDDIAGGSEIIQAVVDYVDAARDGDCEALIDLATEASVQLIGGGGHSEAVAVCEEAVRGGDELAVSRLGRIDSADELVDDDRAGATVTLTTVDADGQSTFFFFSLRREDGAWKVEVQDNDWEPTS
jgi:hypothetical protein